MQTQIPAHSPVAARRAVVLERLEEKRAHLRNISLNPLDPQMRQRLNETLSTRQVAELERELSLLTSDAVDSEEVPVAVVAEAHGITAPDILRLKKTGELHIKEKYLSVYLAREEVRILERYGAAQLLRMGSELIATVTAQAVASLHAKDFDSSRLHIRRLWSRGRHDLAEIFVAGLLLVGTDSEAANFLPSNRDDGSYTLGNLEAGILKQQQRETPTYRGRRQFNPFDRINIPLLRDLLSKLEFHNLSVLRVSKLAFNPTLEETREHQRGQSAARYERVAPIVSASKKLAAKPSNKDALTTLIRAIVDAGYGERLVEIVENEAVGLYPQPPEAGDIS